MNYLRMLIAAIIGAVVNFLLGWLVFDLLLHEVYAHGMTTQAQALNKAQPNLLGIFISCFISALFLAYIFERWANIRSFLPGLMGGAIIGVFMSSSMDISLWSMLNMYTGINFILIDIVALTCMNAITGAVVAWYLGFQRDK